MSVLFVLRSRVSLAFLALGLALVLAAACNGDDGGGTTPAGGETPADGETPAAGETPTGGDTAGIQMVPGNAFDTRELTIAAGSGRLATGRSLVSGGRLASTTIVTVASSCQDESQTQRKERQRYTATENEQDGHEVASYSS